MIKVIKPTEAFLSKTGHKGFFYPHKDKTITIKPETLLTRLPYVSGESFKDEGSALIAHLCVCDNESIVIWIAKKDLIGVKNVTAG